MLSQTSGPFSRGAGCACASPAAATATPLAASTVRRVMSIAPPLSTLKLHLLQDRTADHAQRIAEHLRHFEVIVALGDNQADRLAGRLHRRGELAILPLELRRLVGAVGDDQRAVEAVEMALRGQLLLH